MHTETVLAQILAGVEPIIKAVVDEVDADGRGESPATLYGLEERVQAILPQIGQLVLQALVDGQGSGAEGPERSCGCGGAQRYHDQARPLTMQTSLGPIALRRRAYYRCGQCGATSYPLDARLGLKRAGRMSRYLQEQVGWLYGLLPAGTVQQTLARFGWPPLCVSQIREHAEALGTEMEQREQAQLQVARQEAQQVPAEQGAPRQPVPGSRLYAAPDGVMYCTTGRDQETGSLQWRELKVAAVYAGVLPEPGVPQEPPDPDVAPSGVRERIASWLHQQDPEHEIPAADRAAALTYVAQTAPWQPFGERVWAELWARGLGRPVSDLAVVADGSDHIDQFVDDQLRVPGVAVTRILDLPHAQQHLWAASQAAFGEGSSAGVAWAQAPLRHLERGEVDALLTALEHLATDVSAARPAAAALVRREAAYFVQRRAQLDYPAFVAAGYQIGSGLAESACKRLGTERMKGAGMRWTMPGAQATVTLRMLLLSQRWDEVSTYCRHAA
jgi:hypothetical protein